MPDFHAAALRFVDALASYRRPEQVLDALDEGLVHLPKPKYPALRAYGLWCTPDEPDNFADGYQLGVNTFLHPSLGDVDAYWDRFLGLARNFGPSLTAEMLWNSLSTFTVTECRRITQPSGRDQWVFEHLSEYGIADMLYCPAHPWVVAFWSRQQLQRMLARHRGLLHFMSIEAGKRLEQMMPKKRRTTGRRLTPRERLVLQHLSRDLTADETATRLDIEVSSVRKYIERAKKKLQATTTGGLLCKAMRRRVIK